MTRNLKHRIAQLSRAIEPRDGSQRLRYLRDREKTLKQLINDLPAHEQLRHDGAVINWYFDGTPIPRENLHPHYAELTDVQVEISELDPKQYSILDDLSEEQVRMLMENTRERLQKEKENELESES